MNQMPALRIKKINVFTAVFIPAFLFAGFLPLAAIIVTLFSYLVAMRPPSVAAIKASGVPALFAIFLIASVSTLALNAFPFSPWNTSKDAYFFIAPVLLLVSGLTLFRSEIDFSSVVRTAVNVLSLSSVIIYFDFLVSGGLASVSLESRYYNALDSSASTLALLLIVSLHPTASSLLRNKKYSSLLLFNLLLVFASLSRVDIAVTLISLFFVYAKSKWAGRLTIFAVLFLIVAPVTQVEQLVTMRVGSGNASFFDKLLRSFEEFRISDYSSAASINNNWRGYEAYLGVLQVERVGGIARFIGVGFGSYVEGPFEDKLNQIPFFHNGFVTIYFKAGFLGLSAFAFFIFKLFRLAGAASHESRRTGNPRIKSASVMIYLLTIAILLNTLAVHGVYYSKTTLELFFIALAICSLQLTKRNFGANG